MRRITMTDDEGRDWLARIEGGYRLTAYKDGGGVWTISAGVTFYSNGRRVQEGDVLHTVEDARQLFGTRLHEFESHTDVLTRDDLTQTEFNAVCALIFNIGPGSSDPSKPGGFTRSTVRKAINAKVLDPWYAWKMWNKIMVDGVLVVDPGVVNRRAIECYLYTNGIYKVQGEMSNG